MEHAIYGFKLGAQLLWARRLKHALPYLVRPVNYWRTLEFAQARAQGDFREGQRVLDIGSPKLLSLYLAEKVKALVSATDVEPYFLEKLEVARQARGIPPERLRLEVQDGRRLSYPDESFDRVYSISVLEHIPDRGDSECAKEIGRVLKPGGRAVITVPFLPKARDEYRKGGFYWAGSSRAERGRGIFYQRRYSEEHLRERLIGPSGLQLHSLNYVGELAAPIGERELSDFMPVISGPIQPLLSKLLHTAPTGQWRDLKKPLCAVITLVRPPRG
ncbi:MAG: SAM-dependent methyltransferase [Myxococcaceae bacterium]